MLSAVIGWACGSAPATSPVSPSTTVTPSSGPIVTLSPTVLTFANATGGAQAVTLTNAGTVTLNISSIAIGGNFVESHDCGSAVPVGASCTISVTFAPLATTAAVSAGALTINDDAVGSPQSLPITGPMVTSATAVLSPKSLAFVDQAVGTRSSAQAVTLTNLLNGAATVALGLISVETDGDFQIAQNGCSARIVAGGSCTILVAFTPTAPGPRAGALSISDNARVGLAIVPLGGVGR